MVTAVRQKSTESSFCVERASTSGTRGWRRLCSGALSTRGRAASPSTDATQDTSRWPSPAGCPRPRAEPLASNALRNASRVLSSLASSSMCSAMLTPCGHGNPMCSKDFTACAPEPRHTTVPPASSSTWSRRRTTCDDGWWMLIITMRPAPATECSSTTSPEARWASSPEVGSSRSSTLGSVTSSMAMLSRRRSPPEMPRLATPPTSEPATPASPSSSITCSTRATRPPRDVYQGMRSRPEYTTDSRTVRCGRRRSSWGTWATRRR
mmetsp:Transcript_6253/g.21979  ORF Transcript_6253/g.21979 Transcript_6253/m.21979 type:complete len:266 (-) Transcript_6253:423-1220(-)